MASETGMRWLIITVLYFFIMTIIVSAINSFVDTPLNVTNAGDTGFYCDNPRTIYEAYQLDPVDTSDISKQVESYYNGQIDCGQSVGVLLNTTCLSINGCTWEEPTFLWWSTGEATCTGQMNYTSITENLTTYIRGTVLTNYDPDYVSGTDSNIGDVCSHPNILYNQTLCNIFSCTWSYHGFTTDIDTIEPSIGLFGTVWKSIKGMFMFSFNLGIDNVLATLLIMTLIFWIPLLTLIGAIVVVLRG